MLNLIRVFVAVIVAAVALAIPAAADTESYLRPLQEKYVFLSEQQLLDEGVKICSVIGSGRPAADAVQLVVHDLGTSVSTSGEIVSAAVTQLGC